MAKNNKQSQDSNSQKEAKDLEKKKVEERNFLIVRLYIEHYNELILQKNSRHTITDVWNAVLQSLTKFVQFFLQIQLLTMSDYFPFV